MGAWSNFNVLSHSREPLRVFSRMGPSLEPIDKDIAAVLSLHSILLFLREAFFHQGCVCV